MRPPVAAAAPRPAAGYRRTEFWGARASPRPNAGFHEPCGDVAAKRISLLLHSEIYTETKGYSANKDSLRVQSAVSS